MTAVRTRQPAARVAPREPQERRAGGPSSTRGPAKRQVSTAGRSRTPVGSSTKRSTAAKPRLKVHQRRLISLRAFSLLCGAAFFVVLFAAVTIQTQRIEGQQHMDELERSITSAQDRDYELRAQVAEREAPQRVMTEARALGMVDPGPVAPLVANGSISDPAPLVANGSISDPAPLVANGSISDAARDKTQQ